MVFSSIFVMKFRGTFFINFITLFNSIKYYGNFIYEIKRIHSHLSHFSNQTTTIDNDHLFLVQEKLKTLGFLSVIIKAWIYFNLLLLFNYFFLKLNVEIRYFSNIHIPNRYDKKKLCYGRLLQSFILSTLPRFFVQKQNLLKKTNDLFLLIKQFSTKLHHYIFDIWHSKKGIFAGKIPLCHVVV